jgi:hypothetical protein
MPPLLSSGIRFIPGSTAVLIVAPHGPVIEGTYQNDLRTGIIAAGIQRQLNCCALINDRFFKPKGNITKSLDDYFLDLFRIDHARKVPGYLACIKEVVESDKKTRVIWVHGIANDVAVEQGRQHIAPGLFEGGAADLHALIGWGQGGDPKTGERRDNPTAQSHTVDAFRDLLTTGGMTTLHTRNDGPNFRGRDAKRLNQWFRQEGFGLDQVESIQLEIKEQPFRDSRKNAEKTAGIIAGALAALPGGDKQSTV